ncbi:hypothetical protein BU14_0053s0007 [Porphyra umbilicalis]|uniref:DOMON domain-containing protein n=1 Tax=Porphyra umbilicalis TaxID=2786 RepID=A0A1X6PHM1_PORUM|nr:hypothetical protein BU14_0053s0007 [Porphyra umbilicalis]|eukprot:OSX80342.1 hypothetical protein BU14_0053s0007 [Porphyra umbilicalis]
MAVPLRSFLVATSAVLVLLVGAVARPASAIVAADNSNCRVVVAGVTRTYGHCTEMLEHRTAANAAANIKIFWAVNGTTMSVLWTSNSTGWSAFGLTDSPTMIAPAGGLTLAVVGYSTSTAPDVTSVGMVALTARSPTGVIPLSANDVTAAGYYNLEAPRNADGLMAVSYDRVHCTSPVLHDGDNSIVWAAGPPPTSGLALLPHGAAKVGTGFDWVTEVEEELCAEGGGGGVPPLGGTCGLVNVPACGAPAPAPLPACGTPPTPGNI